MIDPVTAAGIGLSVTSLAIQVFSGCIKGYEMFIEVVNMPKEYEHLRTRLRIEQSRCLLWGEQVGLAEDLLEDPSRLLEHNGNLIMDILHQVQLAFRSCIDLTYQYDPSLSKGQALDAPTYGAPTKRRDALLQKTLAIWKKSGRVASRIDWAMIRKGSFEKLITRLIQYNDRMEGFLDRAALTEVRALQDQSNLTLLQMARQLDEVRILVEAMHISGNDPSDLRSISTAFSKASTLCDSDATVDEPVASLAMFKAHRLRIQMMPSPGKNLYIPHETLTFDTAPKFFGRQFGTCRGQKVWVEWRESVDEALSQDKYRATVEERVEELAAILAAPDRPKEFRSPNCIGYYRSEHSGRPRYALVYSWPSDMDTNTAEIVSLRDLLTGVERVPSLNARIRMAKMLAESLLYLHAVDWIHKDIRSSNVLFLANANQPVDLSRPILSGFDFSRPALPDAVTVSHQFSNGHDLYRHPDLLGEKAERSKKSYDMYSLGLVMAEIAMWSPIEQIVQVEVTRRQLAWVRPRMLSRKTDVLAAIDERVGWTYSDVVSDCIRGGAALELEDGADEEEGSVAADLLTALHRKVVLKLQGIKI